MVYFQFQIERNANSISNLSALASLPFWIRFSQETGQNGVRGRIDHREVVEARHKWRIDFFCSKSAQESLHSLPWPGLWSNFLKILVVFYFFLGWWFWLWLLWQIKLARMLVEAGQSHLFQSWAEPGVEDEEKRGFFEQVFFFLILFLCGKFRNFGVLVAHRSVYRRTGSKKFGVLNFLPFC